MPEIQKHRNDEGSKAKHVERRPTDFLRTAGRFALYLTPGALVAGSALALKSAFTPPAYIPDTENLNVPMGSPVPIDNGKCAISYDGGTHSQNGQLFGYFFTLLKQPNELWWKGEWAGPIQTNGNFQYTSDGACGQSVSVHLNSIANNIANVTVTIGQPPVDHFGIVQGLLVGGAVAASVGAVLAGYLAIRGKQGIETLKKKAADAVDWLKRVQERISNGFKYVFKELKIPLAISTMAMAADRITTFIAFNSGGVEGNPLAAAQMSIMGTVGSMVGSAMVGIGTILCVSLWAERRLQGIKRNSIVKPMLYGVAIAESITALNNFLGLMNFYGQSFLQAAFNSPEAIGLTISTGSLPVAISLLRQNHKIRKDSKNDKVLQNSVKTP